MTGSTAPATTPVKQHSDRRLVSRRRSVVVLLAAVVTAFASNMVVSAGAVAAGADPAVDQLGFVPILWWTTAGIVVGFAGWISVRRFAPYPRTVLGVLVPLLTLASFVPDLQFFDTAAGGPVVAVALMVMHVVVVAVAVPTLARIAPVRAGR